MAQPFSSGSPIIDQLFSREFAQRQAEQAALEAAATRGVQRQQIQAQSDLARAQQQSTAQQQEYNNLFRMQELGSREKAEADRNTLLKRELDIREKASRVSTDEERRKAAIIDANAAAVNDAQRANALYKINFDKMLTAEKAKRTGFLGTGLGSTAGVFDDPKSPDYKKVQNQAFDTVRTQLLAEKGGALNSLIPDPDTFTFRPVQYDETGKAIALPIPSTSGTVGGGYDYMGNPINPAGLGPSAAPAAVPAAPTTTSSGGPGVGDMFRAALVGAMPSVFGATATPKGAPVPQPSVRRAFGNSTVLLTPEDDATLARQLLAVPAEQRPAAYRAMVDQWLQSGRARIMAPPVTISPADAALPNYNAYQ